MTVDATTPAFARPRLDVGLTFKGGWNAFAADIVALLVGGLIACLLSVVTLGILAGPLAAGLYSMVIGRIRDGRRAEIGDVFSCMDRFWSFLWAAIVLVVLIALASLTIIGGVLLATVWLYVFPFMVDRKMGLTDAMSASYHQVVDNGFWEHLVLLVIVFAIGAVGNGWIGLLTTPFTIALVAAAYFVSGGRGDLIEHPRTPPAPPAPTWTVTQPAPAAPTADAATIVDAPTETAQTTAPAETAPAADEAATTAVEAPTAVDAATETAQTTAPAETAPPADDAPTAEA